MKRYLKLCIPSLAMGLASCGSLNSTVQGETAHANYAMAFSKAAARTQNEQLLLNIVKLRYNDPVSFVEMDNFIADDTTLFSRSLDTGLGIDVGAFDEVLGISGTFAQSHSPQTTFKLLKGDKFAKQMLSPLAPEKIFALSQSGWSIERLMLCCVSSFGTLENARAAAGPTPKVLPNNSEFETLASLLRTHQSKGNNTNYNLRVQIVPEDRAARSSDGSLKMVTEKNVVMSWGDPDNSELRSALENAGIVLEPGKNAARIARHADNANESSVRGRSLLGIMSALSQTVNVPDEHSQFVQATQNHNGNRGQNLSAPSALAQGFHESCIAAEPWTGGIGKYFAVAYSRTRPDNATAVPYRGYWFYVDDRCRDAKSTLLLLGHLYALQAGVSGAGESDSLFLLGAN